MGRLLEAVNHRLLAAERRGPSPLLNRRLRHGLVGPPANRALIYSAQAASSDRSEEIGWKRARLKCKLIAVLAADSRSTYPAYNQDHAATLVNLTPVPAQNSETPSKCSVSCTTAIPSWT